MIRGDIRAALFFLLLGVLLVAPIWLVAYPPLLDYPNTLARTYILARLRDPGSHFHQFYQAAWGLYPYLSADVILVGLNRVLPAELAGRIFLSFCVLALPLSAWFFIRQANPGQDHMGLWALVITHNIFFLYAFLNFYLSLSVCFLALGLWLRYLARPGLLRWCAALAAMTALYLTHLMGFCIAAVLVTGYALISRVRIRTLLLSGVLFLPGAFLYLRAGRLRASVGGEVAFRSIAEKIRALSAFMHGYSPRLDLITMLALAAYFLAAWWRNPEFKWNYRWVGVAGGTFAVYWALPEASGGGAYIDIRVLPVLFVLLLVTAQTGRHGRRLALVALALFLVRMANLGQNFVAAQPELAGLARSFAATTENARVLPIVEADDPGEEHVRHPFAHFWAYGIIERGWFAPYLWYLPGVTPLRTRHQSYTNDGFWVLSYDDPFDWPDVQEDYDYVWAYNVSRFSNQLAAIGELVYADGKLEVYRMKKPKDEP